MKTPDENPIHPHKEENILRETTKPLSKPYKTGLEVSISSSPEAAKDLSAFVDALNHDQPITRESLDKLGSSIKEAKIKLGDEEITVEQAESLYGSFGAFLKETYKIWGVDEEKIKNVQIRAEIKSPKDENYASRKADIDEEKFGQFTLNPDTQGLDWETLKEKIFIPDLSALNGKSLQEVAEYLIANYAGKYKLPGLEYWKFMLENPDKVPDQLKDGNYYFNFGSLVRNSGGRWNVPCARWGASGWYRFAGWLVTDWYSYCRVVLLEI